MSLTSAAPEAHLHRSNLGAFVLFLAVLGRPRLWLTALVTARGLVRSHWWRTKPFLPLPDPRWIGFRLETAYGSAGTAPNVEDVVGYLEWCQMMRKIA
ncbi:MAG TPA: hypothetical protein VNE42_11505 [Acidimicrobiales bacterium]|nr:hypothetical protein [Acidimicrobiales bacterium]